MKIPQDIDQFRSELENLVEPLAKKHNIDIAFKTMRFEGDGTTFSCTMSVTNKEINGKTVEQVLFEKHCHLFDFTKEQYKVRFKLQNEEFELLGFNTRATKNNCKIKSLRTGQTYGTNNVSIHNSIKRNKK